MRFSVLFFLGENCVSYIFVCLTCPIISMSRKKVTNLTWFSINQFPPIDIYFCQSGIFNWSFDLSIFKACDTFRTSGRSTPVTCPTAPLLPEYNLRTFEKSLLKSKETTLWPGWPGWTGRRCWRGWTGTFEKSPLWGPSSPKKLRCDRRSRKSWCPLYANTLMRQ